MIHKNNNKLNTLATTLLYHHGDKFHVKENEQVKIMDILNINNGLTMALCIHMISQSRVAYNGDELQSAQLYIRPGVPGITFFRASSSSSLEP